MSSCITFRCKDDYEFYESVLKDIDVKIEAHSAILNVESVLKYENKYEKLLEADFEFPFIASASIYHFEMKTKDKSLVAECRGKEEAKETYDKAVEDGHTAAYSYESPEMSDVFRISLGNIPPKSEILIKICFTMMAETSYIQKENGFVNREVVFVLPQVLHPRYNPNPENTVYNMNAVYAVQNKYKFSFKGDLNMDREIEEVKCTGMKIKTESIEGDKKRSRVNLDEEFDYQHDVELRVILKEETKDAGTFKMFVEEGKENAGSCLSKPCVAAVFVPPVLDNVKETRNEFIFVIDRSGSMDGPNIESAKESLLLFLRSLPKDSRMGIIGFGSSYSSLFDKPVDLTEENMNRALDYQKNMKADMGGTEMFNALKHAFETSVSAPGWQKQIILITDGDIYNSNEVKSLVAQHEMDGRIFAIGLGDGVSTSLVSGLAEASHGKARFAREPSQLRRAVMEILKLAVQPRASDVEITWNFSTNRKVNMLQIPSKIRSVYADDPIVIYGIFDGPLNEFRGVAVLKYKMNGESFKITEQFSPENAFKTTNENKPLHRIACKAQINELNIDRLRLKKEDKNKDSLKEIEEKMKLISIDCNVISSVTAFICVDPDVQKKDLETVKVISQPTIGGPSQFMACCAPPPMAFCKAARCAPQSLSYCMDFCDSGPVKESLNLLVCDEEERVEEEVTITKDPFVSLVELQNFDGTWTSKDSIINIINKVIEPKLYSDILAKKPTGVENDTWITMTILVIFEKKFNDKKIEWEMIHDNSMDALKKKVSHEKFGEYSKLISNLII